MKVMDHLLKNKCLRLSSLSLQSKKDTCLARFCFYLYCCIVCQVYSIKFLSPFVKLLRRKCVRHWLCLTTFCYRGMFFFSIEVKRSIRQLHMRSWLLSLYWDKTIVSWIAVQSGSGTLNMMFSFLRVIK